MTVKLPTPKGAGEMIKAMRYLTGSRIYHSDVHIRELLRAQKDRVGRVLDLLDTQVLPNNPRRGPSLPALAARGPQGQMGHVHEGQVCPDTGQDNEDHQRVSAEAKREVRQ